MSVAKTSEITASSSKSFEDAVRVGVRKMSETVKGIEGAWVKEQKVVVKDGEVVAYRVTMKVTFIVR
jgi:flavin-binding protein dodecin